MPTWTKTGNIRGPTGATGATGATGPQGPQGPPGTGAGYSQLVGDGSTTVFTITHNLNTVDVFVTVREAAGNQSIVYPEVQVTGLNTVVLIFDVAPATNAYRVACSGGATAPINPAGPAGGDLGGTFPNPTVLQARAGFTVGGLQLPPPLVTTLPASPVDGQEVYLLVNGPGGASDQVIWHLRYRASSSSTFKWDVLGSPPNLYSFSGTGPTTTGANQAMPGAPQLTAPRSGDYDLGWGCRGDNNSAGGGWWEVRPQIGAVAPVVNDALTQFVQGNGAGNAYGATHFSERRVTANAGDVIQLRADTSGITVAFLRLWLQLRPVRVS